MLSVVMQSSYISGIAQGANVGKDQVIILGVTSGSSVTVNTQVNSKPCKLGAEHLHSRKHQVKALPDPTTTKRTVCISPLGLHRGELHEYSSQHDLLLVHETQGICRHPLRYSKTALLGPCMAMIEPCLS